MTDKLLYFRISSLTVELEDLFMIGEGSVHYAKVNRLKGKLNMFKSGISQDPTKKENLMLIRKTSKDELRLI